MLMTPEKVTATIHILIKMNVLCVSGFVCIKTLLNLSEFYEPFNPKYTENV